MLTWVIGHRGFIGACLVRELATGTHLSHIVLYTNRDLGIPDFNESSLRIFADASRGKDWQIAWLAGPSGPHHVNGVSDDAMSFGQFLELAARYLQINRGRIVFLSSAGASLLSKEGDAETQSTHGAENAYLSMKVAQELRLREMVELGGEVCILRISTVYGPRCAQTGRVGLVETLVRNSLSGRVTEIFAPMSLRRDYVFNRDLVPHLSTLVGARVVPASLSCQLLASGVSYTIREVVERVEYRLGIPVRIAFSSNANADLHDHVFEPDLRILNTPLNLGVDAVIGQFRGAERGTSPDG